MKRWIVWIVAGALLLFGGGAPRETTDYTAYIRLHVVANSDSAADQAEKLRVRDAVLAVLEQHTRDCPTKAAAAREIRLCREELLAAGRAVLRANGHALRALELTFAEEEFPSISYRGRIVPGGTYLALRIQIGAAAGHNWWCVLFPPLCYAEVHTDEDLPDDGELHLKWHLCEWFAKETPAGI